MNFQWDACQNEIRSKYAEIGISVSHRTARHRFPCRLDQESWVELTELGFWRIAVDSKYGGEGLTWWEFVAAFEGLTSTARDIGFSISVIAQAGAIWIISKYGSDEQKSEFLPRLIHGEIASTASTESHGGSDVARVRTKATFDGNRLRLSGTKSHITNAPIAEIFVILGRIPAVGSKKDITLFLLDRSDEGISTSEPEEMLGSRTSPTGNITLSNIPIDDYHILGVAGNGLALVYNLLSLDRPLIGLMASSYAQSLVADALCFAETRGGSNKPLSEHQYIQDKIVQMKANMEVTRYISYAALERLFEDQPEAALLSSIAKLVGTDGLWHSAQEFAQLHGHQGYMEGDVSWIVRDVMATTIAGGTSEMQKVAIFNQLQKLHRMEHLQ